MKFTNLFKKWRIWILVFFLLSSYIAINPSFKEQGVAISGVDAQSNVYFAGLRSPDQSTSLRDREIILNINQIPVRTLEEYVQVLSSFSLNDTMRLQTDRSQYIFLKDSESVGVAVSEASTSNLRKGLDLQGGTRVLLRGEQPLNEQQREDVIAVMQNRLNTYGLSDIQIKKSDDLLGNKYISVEVAGASKQEVKELIEEQGKFEAKIDNETVFSGGEKDITFVCRNDGTCSGIRECSQGNVWSCQFEFSIQLSPEAAKRHADVTKDIPINSTGNRGYLSKTLDFYLDDIKVDSLLIGADLKGKETSNIAISGPGVGTTRDEAVQDALIQMNKLQTILITGSLPTKLEVVKLDTISPILGKEFMRSAFVASFLALLAVTSIIFIRYRKIKITIPILITSLSEVFIVLGIYALFKANLDLAAIAGIIAAVGTGVNDQIVITDEVLNKETSKYLNQKRRIKRAFFIIMAAYATGFASMLPLLRAGAGLLTGFALTTILGITVGVLITRPAYASALETLVEE